MKLLAYFLSFAFVLTMGNLQAHPGHDHDHDQEVNGSKDASATKPEDEQGVDPAESVEAEEYEQRIEAPN